MWSPQQTCEAGRYCRARFISVQKISLLWSLTYVGRTNTRERRKLYIHQSLFLRFWETFLHRILIDATDKLKSNQIQQNLQFIGSIMVKSRGIWLHTGLDPAAQMMSLVLSFLYLFSPCVGFISKPNSVHHGSRNPSPTGYQLPVQEKETLVFLIPSEKDQSLQLIDSLSLAESIWANHPDAQGLEENGKQWEGWFPKGKLLCYSQKAKHNQQVKLYAALRSGMMDERAYFDSLQYTMNFSQFLIQEFSLLAAYWS